MTLYDDVRSCIRRAWEQIQLAWKWEGTEWESKHYALACRWFCLAVEFRTLAREARRL